MAPSFCAFTSSMCAADINQHDAAEPALPRIRRQQFLEQIALPEPEACDASAFCDVTVIGKGSTAVILRCSDRKTGQTFAVKKPSSPRMRQAANSPSGHADAKMLEELQHRNVLAHRNRLPDGSMIMEYLDGGSLLDVMERSGGSLSEDKVAGIARQILSGLAYLHSKGVIHKDIKPANILADSTTGTVKIADIATAAESQARQRLGVTFPIGTPVFLAPEVVRTGNHAAVSDVWAVGCTVLQLLTGRPPWDEEEHQWAAMFKVGSGQHPRISGAVGEAARSFLMACFQQQESRASPRDLLCHPFLTKPLLE